MAVTPLHTAALEYARQGWHVFPLVPLTKRPIIENGHLHATTDPAQVDAWWTQHPNANIGVAVEPSGLYVLDVDTSRKKDGTYKRGRESLAQIDHELTDTLTATTPRGGLHAVYARPPGVEPYRNIDFLGTDSGLDLLGKGYIVVQPSVFVDRDNSDQRGEYRWNRVVPIAPLPPFLHNFTRPSREKVQLDSSLTGAPLPEGGRNVALFRLGAALRDSGIGPQALAAALHWENQNRCNPPLDEGELAQIVQSVLARVQPSRDVAAGAIIAQDIANALAPPTRSEWLESVALTPQPPMLFYPTGFEDLDRLIGGGFATRQLCGIIGPPSAGKSALVGHWLLTLARQRPVLHCSTELPRHELFVRYAAHKLEFPWRDGMKGAVPQERMAEAVRGTRIKLLGCDDLDRVDPLGCIWTEVERMRDECGVAPVIAIDYIQMMARAATTEMRHKVGELTMRARMMAQAFDTVVLGVFSTQRVAYSAKSTADLRKSDDPTAYLGAAKESGDIEFDCATLMYLDVDKLHEGNPKPARIAVARCRVGDVGFVGLRAQLDIGKFWSDAAAVIEMRSEEREGRHLSERIEQDLERFLETVDLMDGRPWREVRAAYGNGKRAEEIRSEAFKRKLIVSDMAQGYDEMGRVRKHEVIKRIKQPPPGVQQSEDV